jgi:hypothetical protein
MKKYLFVFFFGFCHFSFASEYQLNQCLTNLPKYSTYVKIIKIDTYYHFHLCFYADGKKFSECHTKIEKLRVDIFESQYPRRAIIKCPLVDTQINKEIGT